MAYTIMVISGLELIRVDDTEDIWEYEIVNPRGKLPMGRGSGFTQPEADK